MTDIVDISETEKRYRNEWLLFEVLETGELDEPLKGRLLCHSPDQDVVYAADQSLGPLLTYMTYAGPVLPDGQVAVL
jgi:hypothetical protein